MLNKCEIKTDSYVLDIGCGVGRTSCYLAKKYGCKVIGIDISKNLVGIAKERAKKEDLLNIVEFKHSDVRKLPFNSEEFDIVISESVTSLSNDKNLFLNEYKRVTKIGGYIGLNEVTWINGTYDTRFSNVLYTIGGIYPETSDNWIKLLKQIELKNISSQTNKLSVFKQIEYNGLIDVLKSVIMLLKLSVYKQEFRFINKNLEKNFMK